MTKTLKKVFIMVWQVRKEISILFLFDVCTHARTLVSKTHEIKISNKTAYPIGSAKVIEKSQNEIMEKCHKLSILTSELNLG